MPDSVNTPVPLLTETDLPGVMRATSPVVHYNSSFLVEPYREGWGGLYGAPLGHLYWIVTSRGVGRKWGRHEYTTDRYTAVYGTIEVALFDGREGSPTQGELRLFTLEGEAGDGLLIPPGVWHTFRTLTETGILMNSKNPAYNPDNVDKETRPMPNDEIPFVWS